MNAIRRHIPNFAWDPRDGLPPKEEFSTTEELLELEFVKRWKSNKDLDRFSISIDRGNAEWSRPASYLLMAEMKDGKFWVVGRFDSLEGVDLPEWSKR